MSERGYLALRTVDDPDFGQHFVVNAGQQRDANNPGTLEMFALGNFGDCIGGAPHHFLSAESVHVEDRYAVSRCFHARGRDRVGNVVIL